MRNVVIAEPAPPLARLRQDLRDGAHAADTDGANGDGADGDAVRLNAFFTRRGSRPHLLDWCPGCDRALGARPFARVDGAPGSEGEGVAMPAVRCTSCDLVFLNPRLPAGDVEAFYRGSAKLLSYFTGGFKARVDRGRGFFPFAAMLERRLAPHQRDLYDIGCGTGAFLHLMAERGFQVAGAELSPPAAKLARRWGLDVVTAGADAAIDRLAEQGRRFDVVTMIHTFEHLPNPLRTLERLKLILHDDGVVALNVPNVRSFLAVVDRWFSTSAAGLWDPVGHFSYFSLASLSRLCERAGYSVVARSSRLLVYGRPGILGALDAAGSLVCRVNGGIGSNISIVARLRPG